MTLTSVKSVLLALPLLVWVPAAAAQAIPAATGPSSYQGFNLPLAGDLTYGLTASQSERFGYYNSTVGSTAFSANAGYATSSTMNPFHVSLAFGYQHSTGYPGGNSPSHFFENASLSQAFHVGRWSYNLSDAINYLPDAPSGGGFSGVPGLGDGGVTQPGSDPNQDVLTNNVARITNNANFGAGRQLTGRTSLSLGVNDTILRFVGTNANNVLASDQISGNAGITHAIDQLRSYSVTYSQSAFSYPNSPVNPSFSSSNLMFGYNAQLSRQTIIGVSAGPQRIMRGGSANLPASYNVSVQASYSHKLENSSLTASFNRSVRSGAGITPGSLQENLSGSYHRGISRVTSASITAGYSRGSNIAALSNNPFTTQTITASAQASRSLARYWSVFATFTLLKQSISGSLNTAAAYNGVSSIVSAGISYTPRPIHLGHQ